MSEINTSPSAVVPKVIVAPEVNPEQHIDPHWAGNAMREQGIPDDIIARTSVYMDAGNHHNYRGSVWPAALARLRFRNIDGLNEVPGPVLRLSAVMHGQPRSSEEIIKTAQHEFVHVGQMEYDKRSLAVGWMGIVSLTAVGAVAGNRLTRRTGLPTRALATLGGAIIGHHTGYKVAPHERKARAIATTKTNSRHQ